MIAAERLAPVDKRVIEECYQEEKVWQNQRLKWRKFARHCYWKSRSTNGIMEQTLPPKDTFDLECLQFVALANLMGKAYRAGVRWTPEGRVIRWPRERIADCKLPEFRDVLWRVRNYLPDIIKETRLDNPELALAEFGLSLPEGLKE